MSGPRPQQDARPLYVQVAAQLRQEIQTNELPVGEKVPSRRELSERFGVSAVTAAQAVNLLKSEGVVVGRQGRGTFVVGPGSKMSTHDLPEEVAELRAAVDALTKRMDHVDGGAGMSPDS